MIRIKVYTGPFENRKSLNEDGFIDLPAGSKVKDLLKALGIPGIVYAMGFYNLNYSKVPLDTSLADGDTLSFFAPLAGG